MRKAKEIRDLAERNDPYDEVWCLFDTETGLKQQGRHGLSDAMALAEQWNIDIAVSNPCFELWVLIHEENVQAWIDSHVCQAKCGERLLIKNKALLDAGSLLEQFSEARARAIALEEKHDRDANFAIKDRNPSTRVFILVTALLTRYTGGSSATSKFTE